MTVAALLVAAYLLGSIPSSSIAGRIAGVDLSRHGSGNLGGTNVYRVLGLRYALPVVVVDVGKGFVPAWFFPTWDGSGAAELALAYGLCAIAGHVWSVFLRFEGGKGVATSGGVVIALVPVAALVGVLVWGGLVLLTQTVSLASLSAASILPVAAWALDAPGETVLFTAALSVLVWWTHRGNVRRLLEGREHTFGDRSAEGTESTERGGR